MVGEGGELRRQRAGLAAAASLNGGDGGLR